MRFRRWLKPLAIISWATAITCVCGAQTKPLTTDDVFTPDRGWVLTPAATVRTVADIDQKPVLFTLTDSEYVMKNADISQKTGCHLLELTSRLVLGNGNTPITHVWSKQLRCRTGCWPFESLSYATAWSKEKNCLYVVTCSSRDVICNLHIFGIPGQIQDNTWKPLSTVYAPDSPMNRDVETFSMEFALTKAGPGHDDVEVSDIHLIPNKKGLQIVVNRNPSDATEFSMLEYDSLGNVTKPALYRYISKTERVRVQPRYLKP